MRNPKYGYMIALLPKTEKMMEFGMSHRQIEEELGLEGDRPIHNLLKWQRRKATKGLLKFHGCKPAKTLTVL